MDDAVVVEVGDGGESCANEVCGVGFVVASFSAYSIEEFTAEGEVCDEIDWGYASAWRSCEVERGYLYGCSWSRSSPPASGCFDVPLILFSVRQSHYGP